MSTEICTQLRRHADGAWRLGSNPRAGGSGRGSARFRSPIKQGLTGRGGGGSRLREEIAADAVRTDGTLDDGATARGDEVDAASTVLRPSCSIFVGRFSFPDLRKPERGAG